MQIEVDILIQVLLLYAYAYMSCYRVSALIQGLQHLQVNEIRYVKFKNV